MPIFPNIVYKCFFTFKRGYAIEICIGMNLGLLIQISGQLCYMYISALD